MEGNGPPQRPKPGITWRIRHPAAEISPPLTRCPNSARARRQLPESDGKREEPVATPNLPRSWLHREKTECRQ